MRRRVLQGLFTSAAGVALAPALAASGSTPGASGPAGEGRRPADAEGFDITYGGRRIVGVRYGTEAFGNRGVVTWHVSVDGRPLHLMRRADGDWMTMVDHYQSYPTPLAAARAAVDELGPATLLSTQDDGGGHPDHGVAPSGSSRAEREHSSGLHP
ncbi:tyrosinase family oxidase copper chaperone [Streptomyces sp. NPDC052682]|uniref:tyrosinase family oxidase copper chaperone n=1 Tax=Streptomyces sp. NPDC052682 TaxID=3154954 RepID=UPI003425B2B9